MTAALSVAALVAAYALGYAAACYRPLHRTDNWAWDQVRRRNRDLRDGHARRRPGWYVAQTVFAVEILAALVARPRTTVHNLRHRNDPPPRAAAPAFDPDWKARR